MIVWRKSSHSGTQSESDCVEVAGLPGRAGRAIGVRDSKNPTGPILTLTPADFRALLHHVKTDALDGIPRRRTRPAGRTELWGTAGASVGARPARALVERRESL
jgi:hypothetical protein